MNQRSRAAIFGRLGGAVHFSRVCCSARMHEDDARWPTVHTTGALSDGTPPDFDAGIRWQADRKKGHAASTIRCLVVSFSPGLLAVMPRLQPCLLPAVRAVECAVSNAADPRVGAPCPLVCLVCRPGGRPTFSCDPEAHALRERPSSAAAHAPGGASLYNGAMARLLGLSSAGMCLCWGGLRPSCERAAQPAHTQVRRKRTPRAVAFGYVWRATLEYRRMVSSQAHYPSTRPRC